MNFPKTLAHAQIFIHQAIWSPKDLYNWNKILLMELGERDPNAKTSMIQEHVFPITLFTKSLYFWIEIKTASNIY